MFVAQTQDNRTTTSVMSGELAEEIVKAQAVIQSVSPSPEHKSDLLTNQKDLPAPEYECAHVQTMAVYIYIYSQQSSM